MTPLASPILLRCGYCNMTMNYPREIDDSIPNNVKTIVGICPNCDDGDFHGEVWLDVLNREVPQTSEPT